MWPARLNQCSTNFTGYVWVSLVEGIMAPHVRPSVSSFTAWSINMVLMCSSTIIVSLLSSLNVVSGATNIEYEFLASLSSPNMSLLSLRFLQPTLQVRSLEKESAPLARMLQHCLTFHRLSWLNFWNGVQELQDRWFHFDLPLIGSRLIDVS